LADARRRAEEADKRARDAERRAKAAEERAARAERDLRALRAARKRELERAKAAADEVEDRETSRRLDRLITEQLLRDAGRR
jgi:hypothetical protein